MTDAWQASLLDPPPTGEGPPLRPLAGQTRRTELAHGAWVDLRPGWVTGADDLFVALRRDVDWVAERRMMYGREVAVPRLVRFYDAHEPLPHALLPAARQALSEHYATQLGEPFTTAGLCLYRDGRDSVAWHGDTIGRSRTQDTMVALVVLGQPRPLMLRPRGGGRALRFVLGHGDLFVMGGSCQRTWEHAVPKAAGVTGPRISVQFRPHDVR